MESGKGSVLHLFITNIPLYLVFTGLWGGHQMSQNRPILSQFRHRGLERALSLRTCYSDTSAKSGFFSCLGERVDTELSNKP